MGSIVAEIADKIAANAEALEVRGGTGADGGGTLTLSTSELTVVDGDKLGRIDFQAPLETGADALLVGASIYAEADDTFAADNNSTELVFATGASEAAAEKMRITSDGKVGIGTATPVTDLTVEGPITIKEQAAADADTAGYGQIWVDDAANSPLMYTNDAGADIGITTGSTLNAASLGGVLPVGVTGGSGLTALGTVTEGTLGSAVVFPMINTIQKSSGCFVYPSSNLGMSGGGWTQVKLDLERFDLGNEYSTTGGTTSGRGRWTTAVAGYYRIDACVTLSGLPDGKKIMTAISKDGNNVILNYSRNHTGLTENISCSTFSVAHLAVGSYIEVFVYNGDGSSNRDHTAGATGTTFLSIMRL